MTEQSPLECPSCHGQFPKSRMTYVDEEDTQGYFVTGWYCERCAERVKDEAYQLESLDEEETDEDE